jgi:hypothetical protein
MTSTEFAARYRLLKNVATRGARSFLAQQIELGRMVMVHYLDSGTSHERAATLARLEALRPPARGKLLEIADVDGSPVAVTLFLSSFVDFGTWLDSVSPDQPAPPPLPPPVIAAPVTPVPGDFTRAFQGLDTPAPGVVRAPVPNVEQRPAAPPPRAAGDFTRIFGKVDETTPAATSAESPAPQSGEDDTPTLIMKPVKAPRAAEPVQAAPPPPASAPISPAPPPPSEGGFTAIFGKLGEASLPSSSAPNGWPEPAAAPPPIAPLSPPIAPLPQPALGGMPAKAPTPPPAYPEPAQPGEFTQLFQRISPAGGSSIPSLAPPAPSPFRTPEIPRPIETTPAADFGRAPFADPYPTSPAPLPIPSLGAAAPPASPPPLRLDPGTPPSLGAAPAFLAPPAPNFSGAPPAPNANGIPAAPAAPPPAWGASALPPALGSSLDVGVQSEFTRILGRVAVPPPPPPPMAPPQGGPAGGQKAPAKSMMPLLVALNVVVLLTIAIVAYFMLRRR